MWIDPVTGGDHAIGRECSNHVIDDFVRREAESPSHFPVNVKLDARIVQVLRNENVAHTSNASNLGCYVSRYVMSLLLIVAADLNIDRSWQAQVHDRINQPSRLKVNRQLWQICR